MSRPSAPPVPLSAAPQASPEPRHTPPSSPAPPRRPSKPRRGDRLFARIAADRIAASTPFLGPADRDLINAVFSRGLTIAQLARSTKQPARTVSRRLQRLLAHIARPEFAFVASHHESWPPIRRSIASIVLLQRRTRLDAARTLRISMHTVRRELHAIEILIDQAREMGRLELKMRRSALHDPRGGT